MTSAHDLHDWLDSTQSKRWRQAKIGPECVKTLSYLECVNQAFLGDAIAQAFSVMGITDVPKRLCSGLAPSGAEKTETLRRHRLQQACCTDDVYNPLHVVGEYIQTHLRAYPDQFARQEMR